MKVILGSASALGASTVWPKPRPGRFGMGRALWGVCMLAVVASCAGSAGSGSGAASAGEASPAKPWSKMNREERMEWMGLEVMPKMKAAFVEYDDGFEDFRCQTCHGEKMEMKDFEMPADIYALSPTDPLGEAREYDAEVTDFMANVVVPKMAELLGKEPGSPDPKKGFGCFGCHPAAD